VDVPCDWLGNSCHVLTHGGYPKSPGVDVECVISFSKATYVKNHLDISLLTTPHGPTSSLPFNGRKNNRVCLFFYYFFGKNMKTTMTMQETNHVFKMILSKHVLFCKLSAGLKTCSDFDDWFEAWENIGKQSWTGVHPGRLRWNLQIIRLERNMIFQTSVIMFHVNLQGCIRTFLLSFFGLLSTRHTGIEDFELYSPEN